ncbi:MAG: hypothetical protein Q9162_002517 [Coniocarpon cinnabarinum]
MTSPTTDGAAGPGRRSDSPYQLDLTQTRKACKVLQQNITNAIRQRDSRAEKRDLLTTDHPSSSSASHADRLNDVPIWMVFTGKRHILDRTRLKPHKIEIPHGLYDASDSSICLITSDPQRLYKDAIADPAFPSALRGRITRIIGLQKLKARYKSFESKRQLASEHDLFLADSRVWTYLPKILGKVFFHGGTKRPIPVNIEGAQAQKLGTGEGRRSTKGTVGNGVAKPSVIAKEVEKALHSAVVHLSTSNTTAVKVALAGMDAVQSSANIDAVVNSMISKLIPQGWRNVRAIHIKGPNTPALPVWLADRLWAEEQDVLPEKAGPRQKRKRQNSNPSTVAEGKREHNPGNTSRKYRKEATTRESLNYPGSEEGTSQMRPKLTGKEEQENGDNERKRRAKKLKAEVIQAANVDSL